MTLPTASSLERAWHCPASEHLDAPRVDTVNVDAARGTAVHQFLEDVQEVGRDDALGMVPSEWRDHCAGIDIDRLPACQKGSYAAEVALAYHLFDATARVIGHGIARAYDVTDKEFAGTADVIGITDTEVFVLDYKGPHGHVAPAERNWQLRFLALAAARAYNRRSAQVAIVRVKDDGSSWSDWAAFDSIELDVIADELAMLFGRLFGARGDADTGNQPHVTTGDHCRYCPVQRHCPAHTGMVSALISGNGPALDLAGREAEVWRNIKVARRMLDELDGAVRSRAYAEAIDLGDGRVVALRDKEVRTIDGDIARAVLEETWGEELAAEVVPLTASQKRITDAARKIKEEQGGTIKGHVAAAIEAINEAGGITIERRSVVDEHRAPEIEEGEEDA